MQFLVVARLPFLDPYIRGENQSLLIEAIFWAVIYTIYANVFSNFLRAISNCLPFWDLAKKRGGVFCGNGQDDTVLLAVFGVHHGIAGLMMLYGQVYNDPIMWRHGYLLETGFELGDYVALILKMYPYHNEGMKQDLKVALVFHHLPGIALAAFVFEAGLNYNEHMRAIGMWLLLGACQSCFGAICIYCYNFDTQMKQAASVFFCNMLFFFYCRFYQFPVHAYHLVQDVKSSEEFEGTPILMVLYFGATCLTLFNVGVAADLIPKCIRYLKRAVDGVTPIETESVPLSREERMKNRRSSLKLVMDAIDTMDKVVIKRRSSFETLMHLNAVEDIVRSDRELHDIPADDLTTLNNTVASIQKKFN